MSINIAFPFQDSDKGDYLKLTTTDSEAIKSDLLLLVNTKRNTRFMMPNYGCNLLQFIFEPNDNQTISDIKRELQVAVDTYIPNLHINDIRIEDSQFIEYAVTVRIDYTITEQTFQETDFIIINL